MDWTTAEIVALARTQAAELLKGQPPNHVQLSDSAISPLWRRSRRAPVSAEQALPTHPSEIDLNG